MAPSLLAVWWCPREVKKAHGIYSRCRGAHYYSYYHYVVPSARRSGGADGSTVLVCPLSCCVHERVTIFRDPRQYSAPPQQRQHHCTTSPPGPPPPASLFLCLFARARLHSLLPTIRLRTRLKKKKISSISSSCCGYSSRQQSVRQIQVKKVGKECPSYEATDGRPMSTNRIPCAKLAV